MQRFLIQLAIFFSILLLADRFVGMVLTKNRPTDYGLFLKAKSDFFDQQAKTDVLIIGDSHIADAMDPRTIKAQLGLDAYNLGVYHASPFENYYLAKAALQHLGDRPKTIILGTNPVMFERPTSVGKYTPLILPVVPTLELTRHAEGGFNIDFFSRTFREKYLFSALLNRLRGKPYLPTRKVEDVYRGHLKFFNQRPDADWSSVTPGYEGELNIEQIRYFEETIEMIQEAGIGVVIVHPPIWKEKMKALQGTQAYQNFVETISAITLKHQLAEYPSSTTGSVPDTLTTFEQRDFLNPQHLNYHGGEKFTKNFAEFYTRTFPLR